MKICCTAEGQMTVYLYTMYMHVHMYMYMYEENPINKSHYQATVHCACTAVLPAKSKSFIISVQGLCVKNVMSSGTHRDADTSPEGTGVAVHV